MEKALSKVEVEMSETMMENLARRLERVERENRHLKRGTVAVVGVIVAAVLMGQGGSKSRIIEAEGFRLVDAAGVPRGGLFTSPDGPVGLGLLGKDGKTGAQLLVIEDDSTFLTFTGKNKNIRVALGIESEGDIASLRFWSPSGKEAARLVTRPDGSVGLSLSDKEGRNRAALSLVPDGPVALILSDKDGKAGANLYVNADGSVSLGLSDKDAKAIAALQVGADQSTGLLLSDKDGNARARLGVEPKQGIASLIFLPRSGIEQAAIEMQPNGTARLYLSDKEGTKRAVLGHTALETIRTGVVEQTAASSLVLFDKDGKVLWKAP